MLLNGILYDMSDDALLKKYDTTKTRGCVGMRLYFFIQDCVEIFHLIKGGVLLLGCEEPLNEYFV